jgi:CrcB protein
MAALLSLAAGSVAGGFSRYFLSQAASRLWGNQFPYGTLIVNLLGCLAVGFFSSVAGGRIPVSHQSRLLLMTGFCGAFTTFSAFMLETEGLARGGNYTQAFLNVIVSIVAGYALFRLGVVLGEAF